jgi:hypothetical protein
MPGNIYLCWVWDVDVEENAKQEHKMGHCDTCLGLLRRVEHPKQIKLLFEETKEGHLSSSLL